MSPENDTNPAASGDAEKAASPRRRSGALKSQAYEILKSRIVRGELDPGDFLSERQLAQELGMSKTPIRMALERLEMEGLVTISPQLGVVVREITLHEIADQFEIRLALESFVLRTLAGRLSDVQVERVREHLEAQREAAEGGDIERGVELDTEFHLMFCEFLGNREIRAVMERLRDRMFNVILQVFRVDGKVRLTTSYEEHREIAEALIAGDVEQAVSHLEHHLEYGKQILLSPRHT